MSTVGYAKQQTLALETASPQETLAWGLTTTARKLSQVRVESSSSDRRDALRGGRFRSTRTRVGVGARQRSRGHRHSR